jgi:hypothetical protein
MLFHFANAPLLPLVGQKLAMANPQYAAAMMSSCIIAAQLVMLPIALFVGRTADRIGGKPILLVGFAILPIRAVLYTLSDDTAWLVAVHLLDGIGAGIFGALTPLLLADLMRGTGRYSGPGRRGDRAGDRRVVARSGRGDHRRSPGVQGGIPDRRRCGVDRVDVAGRGNAGDRARERIDPIVTEARRRQAQRAASEARDH